MRCRSWTCNFPVVKFSSFHFPSTFFYYEDLFSGDTWECFLFSSFFCFLGFFDSNVSSKNLLSLFLFVSSKNQTPCTFSYKLITFNSNWQIRQQKQLWKIPTGTPAVKFSVKLSSANMSFVNCFGLKFSPDFQNTEEFSTGSFSIN